MLRSAKVTDAPLIADIYNYYVDNTCITFALEHSIPQIYANMIAEGKYPFLVAETDDGQLSGFIFAHELRSRGAFRWDVELTVYLRPGFEGHGIGKALMTECIQLLTRQGYMNAYSCITLPNDRSIGLHHSLGFRDIGIWEKTGYKHHAWHDVIWLCLPLGNFGGVPAEPIPLKELH